MRTALIVPTFVIALPTWAGNRASARDRLDRYALILKELGPKVPAAEWAKARCVTVLALAKGGFFVGGQGGGGAVTCRGAAGGAWSAPLLLKAGGTTVGAQIGGQKTEILMVWKNVDDIDAVVQPVGVLQGSAQVSAGTAGTGVGSGTNVNAGAGVFTVSHGEGLYAGATFEGLSIGPDGDNEALYGRDPDRRAILVQRKVAATAEAQVFLEAVRQVSR